jgi:hypothetical protein
MHAPIERFAGHQHHGRNGDRGRSSRPETGADEPDAGQDTLQDAARGAPTSATSAWVRNPAGLPALSRLSPTSGPSTVAGTGARPFRRT